MVLILGTNYLTDADFLEGDIAEVIIVIDGVASTSDRQKIEGYLAHKWGITAATSHRQSFHINHHSLRARVYPAMILSCEGHRYPMYPVRVQLTR